MENSARKVSFHPPCLPNIQCGVMNQSHLALKSASSFLTSGSVTCNSWTLLTEPRDLEVFDNSNDISLLYIYGFEYGT